MKKKIARKFTRTFDIKDRMIEAEERLGRPLNQKEIDDIPEEIAAEIEYLYDCLEDR